MNRPRAFWFGDFFDGRKSRCRRSPETALNAASETLFGGSGELASVAQNVYDFEVSGLKVMRSWLGYRMRERSGKNPRLSTTLSPTGGVPNSPAIC